MRVRRFCAVISYERLHFDLHSFYVIFMVQSWDDFETHPAFHTVFNELK